MTRIERIAPFLDALSDDEFDELLSAAANAASDATVYDTLSATEKAQISDALARLDAGEGIAYAGVKAHLKAKLGCLP